MSLTMHQATVPACLRALNSLAAILEKAAADAQARKTIAYLQSLEPRQFEGSEDRTITWQTRSSSKSMQGQAYLFSHVLPNVYFHVTTAYDILRQAGLQIGKQDYLGNT